MMDRTRQRAALLLLLLLARAEPARAEQLPDATPVSDQPSLSAEKFEQITQDELLLTGDVDLRYGPIRLLADTIYYNDETRTARAEGNVVLIVGQSQISGDRLEMNVDTRLATIWNAHGYMDPDVIFTAEKLERISEDKVVITDGTVTTCTQPTPYWSFHVSRATLHLEHYAHMRNVALKMSAAPVFYLPYLLWPMKRDRASGLLLPNVGYSRRRGSFLGNALYIALGRSQDATLFYDRYGQSGTGFGLEYRFVPSPRGQAIFTGYYLDDEVEDPDAEPGETSRERYRFKYLQTQTFSGGYRLLADLNTVSDLDYYLDFERDITQTTSPTVLSQVDFSRSWSHYFLNSRLDRQEQFLSTSEDLTLQRVPELEFRGHGVRLWKTPLYLSFESSAGLFQKKRRFEVTRQPTDPNAEIDLVTTSRSTTYQRFDLFPTISASFTPTPWLDISPSVSARQTFWSRSLADPSDPNSSTIEEDETRGFASYNLSIVGPRTYRIYGSPTEKKGTVFKNTFEPRIEYSYIPEVRGGDSIILFDDVDVVAGDIHRARYSLTSRIFAKRAPRTDQEEAGQEDTEPSDRTGPTQVQRPVVDVNDLAEELKEALKDLDRAPSVGPVEVATFELSQFYSFDNDRPLSLASPVEPDGTVGRTIDSPGADIVASARYNPTASASLDLQTAYDVLFDDISSVSLSANLRSLRYGYLRLSYFLNRDLQGQSIDPDGDPNTPELERIFRDDSQVRVIGGASFLRRKITLDIEGSYDIENSALQDQRYRLGYNTQCCGVMAEVARRDFETIDEIEYRFLLNLRGVGTLLDLQGQPR